MASVQAPPIGETEKAFLHHIPQAIDGLTVAFSAQRSIQQNYMACFIYEACFWNKQQPNKGGEIRGKLNFQVFHELNSL